MSLRAFLFSLKDDAKHWFYFLLDSSLTTWKEMKKQFLEKFFPTSIVARIRKEIYDIIKIAGETLHKTRSASSVCVPATPTTISKMRCSSSNGE